MDKKRIVVVDDERDLCEILCYNLRAVDVNIARLRKKIGRYGQLIVARQGFGYCFRSEE